MMDMQFLTMLSEAAQTAMPVAAAGVVMGLAWTSLGGNALYIEAAVVEKGDGKGGLRTTGEPPIFAVASAALAWSGCACHAPAAQGWPACQSLVAAARWNILLFCFSDLPVPCDFLRLSARSLLSRNQCCLADSNAV